MQVRYLLSSLSCRTRGLGAPAASIVVVLLAVLMGCTSGSNANDSPSANTESDSPADAPFMLLPLDRRIVEVEVVSDAARDSTGWIYAIDGLTPGILAFDAELEPSAATGRRGGGPGEFREPIALAVVRPGRVAVLDRALRRLSFFEVDKESSRFERSGSVALRMPSEGLCVLGGGSTSFTGSSRAGASM